ncbi:MAG: hypothetical protein LC798_21530 [Chloroflexi bacterium]|nr:hypothetical protein [Chloroflexota bacterium]
MPRAATPTVVGSHGGASGLGATPDAAGGWVPPNSILVVRNGSGASINVTAVAPAGALAVPSGIDPTDVVLVVAAGAIAAMGPFDPSYFAQVSGSQQGQVFIDFSAVATVTAFAVILPR